MPNPPSVSSPSPQDSRTRGLDPMMLGAAGLVVFVSIFPRSVAALFLAALAVQAVALLASPERAAQARRLQSPLLWSALAFAGWSLLTAAWSPAPWASLTKPLYLAAAATGLAVFAARARELETAALWRLLQGVLLGLLIGGAILAIENLTDQALTRFFYNMFPGLHAGLDKQVVIENGVVAVVKENNINRRATIITMLLVPGLFASALMSATRMRWAATAGIVVIAAILMRYSAHQSSQAAIVAAVLGFVLAKASRGGAIYLIAAAWVASCLMVVPIVTALHATGIHKNEAGLFRSARHRIVIWNTTAVEIKKHPLFGIGADATAAVSEARVQQQAGPVEQDGEFTPDTAHHAHNAYLQTWYELGAVGAALLAALGIAALAAIRRASAAVQPYLIAEFAAMAGMIAFSFSLWQVWFQGAIGLGVLALLMGQSVAAPRQLDGGK